MDLRAITHMATQRFTKNCRKDPAIRAVRDALIARVRRKWSAISEWENR